VAVALVVVLGMAALAVDVTFFYAAHSQAQKAADAAALAGAKAFVSSGFTSGQLGDPASGGAQALVCNGSSGLADIQALAVARQNKIASGLATNFTTVCNFSTPGNPQITATISRSNLPIFFGRVCNARMCYASNQCSKPSHSGLALTIMRSQHGRLRCSPGLSTLFT
jgi:putative Flp pilus-assembly TadE/G-like protein